VSSITTPLTAPAPLSISKSVLWMAGALFLGLLIYYFCGVDQGAVSIFGNNVYVHEFVHDARHLLGFPCH
jgi:cobalt transporter subunit CbtB